MRGQGPGVHRHEATRARIGSTQGAPAVVEVRFLPVRLARSTGFGAGAGAIALAAAFRGAVRIVDAEPEPCCPVMGHRDDGPVAVAGVEVQREAATAIILPAQFGEGLVIRVRSGS
jgi:hypothetical protein